MSILVDENTKVCIQGITGRDGAFHCKQMLDYGTKVVSGVTPGKKGEKVEGVPVFDTVEDAVKEIGANTTVIYVPAKFAVDAIYEACDSGVKLIVCITEGIPVQDMLKVYNYVRTTDTRLIGPNCPGIISPGKSKVGILPGHIHKPGSIGVISRSGTLTYEVVYNITMSGLGQSTCIGIGGDPIVGSSFIDLLEFFEKDPDTDAMVLIGEIGGTDEQETACYIKRNIEKPVVAYIAGKAAPPGRRMGHAGAIISNSSGTADEKIKVLEENGIPVAKTPQEIPICLKKNLKNQKR